MRRWVCIVALLAGFAGDDFARGARLRSPVPIERLVELGRDDPHTWTPTGAWWTRSRG